jgi:hypothetical protein
MLLSVPGHALLWLIPANWKRTKREEAHVSNMFNFPMLFLATDPVVGV